MKYECLVSDITPLRIPRVYRVSASCNELNIELEIHENIVEAPSKGSKVTIEITTEKEKCLDYYFCGHGYVVSNTKIGDINRVVISLHGFLVVLKSKEKIELGEMEHVYIGASFSK